MNQIQRIVDFSGGLQNKTSRFLMKDNELQLATNADLSEIGKIKKTKGYLQFGSMVESGNFINGLKSYYRKNGEYKFLVGVNDTNDAYGTLRYKDNNNWVNLITNAPVNTVYDYETFMDYCFVVGSSESAFMTTTSILGTTTSTSDNVFGAPQGKYIANFGDRLYVGNCQVNGVKYPSRVYLSSLPMTIVTYINGDQSGTLNNITVDSTKYLKAGMTIDIYKGGTSNKLYTLTITDVNNSTSQIWFSTRQGMSLSNKDEIYVSGKKGTWVILWDTDNDWLDIATDDGEEVTGFGKSRNRLLIFKESSLRQWDGANLVVLTDDYGTTSARSIQTLADWTIFFDRKGLIAISGSTIKKLSTKIDPYIQAIYQYDKICAGTIDTFYKVYIGELGELWSETTSTSTSSTSTSSTSSSTSTTTSFSSTSTSYSTSSTSTSHSTSSTSMSTSSTSTSSTSTTTTTAAPTFVGYGLTYDFSQNNWVLRKYNRRITCFATHKLGNEKKLFFGDDQGYVYEDGNGFSDNGFPIPMEVQTKRYDQGTPETIKELSRIYVDANPGAEATLMISFNGGQFQEVGQIQCNEDGKWSKDLIKNYYDIAFKVSQTGTERSIKLEAITIEFNVIGRQKVK